MTVLADLLLLIVLMLGLAIVGTSRLSAAVRASAIQGIALSLLPLMLRDAASPTPLSIVIATALGTLAIKAILIPHLLTRALREANVRLEVEPTVSLHLSLLLAAALTGVAFWIGSALPLPRPARSNLIVPIAFATLFFGALVLIGRRKAVTQVVGYLLLENGIFVFGQCLAQETPFVVELGILLDLLVGIFVMGIAINHISREFEDIDTEALSTLRDD